MGQAPAALAGRAGTRARDQLSDGTRVTWPPQTRGRRAHRVYGGMVVAQPADLGEEPPHARYAAAGRRTRHELGVAPFLPW